MSRHFPRRDFTAPYINSRGEEVPVWHFNQMYVESWVACWIEASNLPPTVRKLVSEGVRIRGISEETVELLQLGVKIKPISDELARAIINGEGQS